MLKAFGQPGAGLQFPRPALYMLPTSFVLHHQQPCKFKTSLVAHATRDVNFAYQQDIQTKLKPGDFADRIDNKGGHLAAAADWQGVVRLFQELGENTDRNIGLVGDMLVQLQRLAPAAAEQLPAPDAQLLAVGLSSMCAVLLNNITRVNNKLLINIVWALALLPDPAKLSSSPAAAAARTRAVAGFGAAVITRMPKLTAEDMFHVAAALALLGFKPPRTLTRERVQTAGTEQGSNPGPGAEMKFGTLLEKRSIKVMIYLSPKTIADAGFVMSRLVPPGDVSTEWLDLYQKISKQHLASMQPEALVYAGYALARHGLKPSNSWQKAYIAAVQDAAQSLTGEGFPMVLFTLARWQQQRQQQQQQQNEEYTDEDLDLDQQWSAGSSSSGVVQGSGPVVSQSLVDDLLFASHSNRALRDMPLGQLIVMVKAVTELPVTAHPLWVQRLWPLINSKIDAAVANSTGSLTAADLASDLAALLTALPRLKPTPTLPADFVEGLVGNLGLGLQQLTPGELSRVCGALQQLKHTPDVIFQRQLQAAVLQAVPNTAAKDLAVLLQTGLAVGLNPNSSSSSQGLLSADSFCQQLLDAFMQEVQRQVNTAAGHGSAAAARLAGSAQQQRQQLMDSSAATGLWQLPQTLLACVRTLDTAAVATRDSSSSSTSAATAVLANALPQLQRLWLGSTVQLASVMPTDVLLVLLGFVLDLSEEDALVLGLTSSSSSKQSAVAAVLQAGVYQHLSSTLAVASGRGKTSVPSSSGETKNLLTTFGVEDFTELFVIINDAGLAAAAPEELLDAAAEALHGALGSKGPVYGLPTSAEGAADLLFELMDGFKYSLPAKVKARYKKWLQECGLEIPAELTMRKKSSSSSSSKKKQQTAVQALPSLRQDVAPAVQEAEDMYWTADLEEVELDAGQLAAAAAVSPPATPVVENGVVRSSRRSTR